MSSVRSWLAWGALGVSAAGASGCLLDTATHNVCYEVRTGVNNRMEANCFRRWANTAWEEACEANESCADHPDYEAGFRAGFVAHLYNGACEPPVLPPMKYRWFRSETPEGVQAVQEWGNGFRHGVAVASRLNWRRIVTGSLVMSPGPLPPPPLIEVVDPVLEQGEALMAVPPGPAQPVPHRPGKPVENWQLTPPPAVPTKPQAIAPTVLPWPEEASAPRTLPDPGAISTQGHLPDQLPDPATIEQTQGIVLSPSKSH